MDLKNLRPLWVLENCMALPPRPEGLVKFSASVGQNISWLYHHAPMDLKNFRPLLDLENFSRPLPRAEGLVKFSASVGLRKFLSSTTTRRRTCKFSASVGQKISCLYHHAPKDL